MLSRLESSIYGFYTWIDDIRPFTQIVLLVSFVLLFLSAGLSLLVDIPVEVETMIGFGIVFPLFIWIVAGALKQFYRVVYRLNHGHRVNSETQLRCAVCAEDLVFDDSAEAECVICGRHREDAPEMTPTVNNPLYRFAERRGWITVESGKLICPNGHYLCTDCWMAERLGEGNVGNLDLEQVSAAETGGRPDKS